MYDINISITIQKEKVMKRILTVLSVLIIAVVLAGCSKTPLTTNDLSANDKVADAVSACHEARKVDLTGVPEAAIGYVVMSKQFGDALLAVAGIDPCKVTNAFDAQIAEVESKNKTVSNVSGSVGNLGMVFIGADVLKTAFGAAGNTYTSSDNSRLSATNESNSRNSWTATSESYNTNKDNVDMLNTNVESTPTP